MSSYISQWKNTDPASFTREALLGVLAGEVPCIKEKKFVSPEVAQKCEDELSPKLSPYLDVPGPTLLRVGVAQFEFQAISEDQLNQRSSNGDEKLQYFDECKKHGTLHEDLKDRIGLNIWASVVDRITKLLPDYDVAVAQEGPGQKYFSGIFRAINNSTPIHCDWAPYDSRTEDWVINQVTQQAVFNLYLTPVKGGRTEVHDCQWTEDAMEFRDRASYGYSQELVEDRKTAIIQPDVGDLCIFNSRNMHQVFPVQEEGGIQRARLTLSSFMGLIPAGSPTERPKLLLWS